jgi:hypothetical protein
MMVPRAKAASLKEGSNGVLKIDNLVAMQETWLFDEQSNTEK